MTRVSLLLHITICTSRTRNLRDLLTPTTSIDDDGHITLLSNPLRQSDPIHLIHRITGDDTTVFPAEESAHHLKRQRNRLNSDLGNTDLKKDLHEHQLIQIVIDV